MDAQHPRPSVSATAHGGDRPERETREEVTAVGPQNADGEEDVGPPSAQAATAVGGAESDRSPPPQALVVTAIAHVSPATLMPRDLTAIPVNPANLDLIPSLIRVAQLAQTFLQTKVLTLHHLDWNEYLVLRVVAGNPNIRSSHAASRAGMNRATLSGVVTRLEDRGLVRRVEIDARPARVDLVITDLGADLWSRVNASVASAERRFVEVPSARRTLNALSRRIDKSITAP